MAIHHKVNHDQSLASPQQTLCGSCPRHAVLKSLCQDLLPRYVWNGI